MKKRRLLWILPMLVLCSCNNNNSETSGSGVSNTSTSTSLPNNEITISNLHAYLRTQLLEEEIANSNKVEFEEVDNRGGNRINTSTETMYIYNDETTYAEGVEKTDYLDSSDSSKNSTVQDTYQKVVTTRVYDTQKVFYYIVDYADGTKRNQWTDTAKRLPVVAEGSDNYDGVNYLLTKSLPGQLSKQASLISANFISSHILNNGDVMAMTLPNASITKNGNDTIYSLEGFNYSYDEDDGSKVTVLVEFEIKVTDRKLREAKLRYNTSQVRGDETYVEDNVSTYKISYDAKVASSTNDKIIEPTDYFLSEVEEIQPYSYESGNKVILDFNDLPLNSYIAVEASKFAPSKAVDLQMFAVSSSDTNIIKVESSGFRTVATGTATIVVESATGVLKEVEVRVNIPQITRIKYNDISSDIESETVGSNTERYIYTNTTYSKGIYVSANPASALLDDIEITVSDESVLRVTILEQTSSNLELQLEVLENNDAKEVSVTFTSKTNTNVKTTISYHIKDRLSDEELLAKLKANTYKWKNLYGSGYAIMTFTSDNEGTITYYDDAGVISTSTFTFTISDMTFTPVMNEGAIRDYNSGSITLDGEKITMQVNVTDYIHVFEIVRE